MIGGPVCQYETNINTYLDTAKNIYKDLVAIKQNINGEKEIRSRVFQIEMSRDGDAYVPGGKIKERFILTHTQAFKERRRPCRPHPRTLMQHTVILNHPKVPSSKYMLCNSRSILPSYHSIVPSMGPI